ncbi:MAG TPA: hypothetical protein VF171_02360 [Trueperaceae bacterium]
MRLVLLASLLLALAGCCPATKDAGPTILPTAFVGAVRGVQAAPPALDLQTSRQEHVRADVTEATRITDAQGGRLQLADLAAGSPRVYVVGVLAGGRLRADEIHVLAGP